MMTSTTELSDLRVVIRMLSSTQPEAVTECEEEMLCWAAAEWQRLFLHLPWDAYNFFGEFEQPWDAVIDSLHRWCGLFHARSDSERQRYRPVFGSLGLLLLTLVSLRHSYGRRYRQAGTTGARPSHDCETLCQPLLRESAVREALVALYAPSTPLPTVDREEHVPDSVASTEWDGIDFGSLRLHRHGTTSFILSGQSAATVQGRRRSLVLKCIIYPYLRVPAIVRNTRRYQEKYSVPDDETRHLARVWASSSRWILMDFVPGRTLAEHLQSRTDADASAREIRVDLLEQLGCKLFESLADLEEVGLNHCDLSPSNIIIHSRESGETSFVLVDLGVNYLYSHDVPGVDGPDAAYVAPEIRVDARQSGRADLYSLGRLLIAMAGMRDEPDGTVPDAFYAETPLMARFIEDLTDRDPRNRLVIFQPDPEHGCYRQLRRFFEEELEAVKAARAEQPDTDKPWLLAVLSLYTPLAGAPARQRRLSEVRRNQSLFADPRRGMYARWLLHWSRVSALAWYVAAFVVVTWWLRDLDWNWGNHLVTLLQRVVDSPEDEFPVLDALRADDYPIPDFSGNLPVRAVGLSFLLVGARYYQNLFAGITPRVTGRHQGRLSVLAYLAEISMRMFSLVAFVLVLLPTLIQRNWWPICTAIGIICVFLGNWSCLAFTREAVRQAREHGLSTVPSGRISGIESFSSWTPSAAFYSFATSVIGTMIFLGLVEDIYVYAAAVASINIVLFYAIKCSGSSAADVRIALGRACLAAERVRYASFRG